MRLDSSARIAASQALRLRGRHVRPPVCWFSYWFWLLPAACSQSGPATAPADGERAAAVDAGPADAGRPVIYSWIDERGRIHMVTDPAEVPPGHRDRVVATDTTASRTQRLASDRVVLVDLRREGPGGAGPGNYSVVDLAELARHRRAPAGRRAPAEPGALGRWAADGAARSVGRALESALGIAGVPPPRVVLYVTPWCGYCKKAAAHLRRRGVAFVERDIDSDPAAAAELARKLAAAGLSGGGVPVLDVDGTVVIGFDRARIDKLLDER